MKLGKKSVKVFKMQNRRGFAAICGGCLTEGRSPAQACDRMIKALRRVARKRK